MNDTVCCKKCNSVNNYRIEHKANNHCAYCQKCGAFIKNIPHTEPALWMGKYKGIPIKEIEDPGYLEWALKNIRLSENFRQAIAEQIQRLAMTHR